MHRKGIKQYLFIMAALAAVFGFAACGDDDDGPSTAAESAVAVYKYSSAGETFMVTFLDDSTWSQTYEYNGKKVTMAEGTYTGDPTKDGTIKLTFLGGEHLNPMYKDKTIDHPIENGKVTISGVIHTRQ